MVGAPAMPITKNPLILKNSRRITSIIMWCHKFVRAIIRNKISRGRMVIKASILLFPLRVAEMKIREKNKIVT